MNPGWKKWGKGSDKSKVTDIRPLLCALAGAGRQGSIPCMHTEADEE